MKGRHEEIVEGVSIDRRGTVAVTAGWQQTLCDIAIELQELTDYPVDVEHLLAALVMSVRDEKIVRGSKLTLGNREQNKILVRYVEILFQQS